MTVGDLAYEIRTAESYLEYERRNVLIVDNCIFIEHGFYRFD